MEIIAAINFVVHVYRLRNVLINIFCCRAQGPIECEHLKNNVTLDCEKTEEKLMHRLANFFLI